MLSTLKTLAMGIAALPTMALAHPHEFYDGGADFMFNADGALEAVRIVWVYDEFVSLFLLSELGIDPMISPEGPERARLAASQTAWSAESWDGDAYLTGLDGTLLALGDPRNALATIDDGRIVVIFERHLDEPIHVTGPVVLELYDPNYYAQYTITKIPRVVGREGCAVEVIPFEMTPEKSVALSALMTLTVDETPQDDRIGAEFAERLVLTCG